MAFFNEFPHTRTYDNDLGWIIKRVGSYDETMEALNQWIETNTPKIEDLEEFNNALESGDLPAGVEQGIRDWCSENLIDLMTESIKNVFFGLTSSGYFCAYIPESWSNITFGTIQDGELYGHLTLEYD